MATAILAAASAFALSERNIRATRNPVTPPAAERRRTPVALTQDSPRWRLGLRRRERHQRTPNS